MNYIFLDNGFEEIEAITTIDLLRRANIALTTVSVTGVESVLGAHNIAVKADKLFADVDFADAEMLILPGGATKLYECQPLCDLLIKHNGEDKLIAAICAGPIVLGKANILVNEKTTSYPGFENELKAKEYLTDDVVISNHIITSRGPATAFKFAFEIANYLGLETKNLLKGMLFE